MSEDKNKGPILPISGLVILLAALGLTIFPQSPFKGSRPSVTELREPYEKIRARLWQDPFRAVVDYVKAPGTSAPARDAGHFGLSCALQDNMTAEDSLLNQIQKKRETQTEIIILGVMVFGGPFADETEMRIRMRYAALSGLRRLNFEPEDPEHIDYISIVDKGKPTTNSLSNILPFEWLTHPDNRSAVLLLWISDEVFQKAPLSRLARLIQCLGLSGKLGTPCARFKVIGPAGSTTLQEMLREAKKDPLSLHPEDRLCLTHKHSTATDPPSLPLLGLEIYSAMATVDDSLLLKSIEPRVQGLPEKDANSALNAIKERFGKHGVTFERTIPSDTQLAENLVKELGLRGVDLSSKEGQHLLLVAEWDTFYGRSLPETFKSALQERLEVQLKEGHMPGAKVTEEVNRLLKDRVHRMSYLRGIDGSLPGEKEEKKDDQADQKTKAADEIKKLEQPTGKSQYDYLRRLAEETYLLDRDLKCKEAGIRAIGILGSDFYDKYLALQAFRQRFPQAIFFTTDLDARLLHPANIQSTRNLVVASGFDLSLRKDISENIDIQGDVPPFRDNYQTALFFAILRAFTRDRDYGLRPQEKKALGQPVPPLIFEIGWTKAHNLTDLKAGDWGVQPGRRETTLNCKTPLIILGLVILLVLLCLTSDTVLGVMKTAYSVMPLVLRKPLIIAVLVFLLGTAICASFYWFILTNPGEEPFSLFEGISIWPTELLRVLAFVLSLCFLRKSGNALRKNREEIEGEFCCRSEPEIDGSESPPGTDCHEEVSTWNAFLTILKTIGRSGGIGGKLKAFWNCVRYDWQVEGHNGMRELWTEYVRRDSLPYRLARLIPIVLSYLLLCSLIILTLGSPVTPLRGDRSYWLNFATLMLSVPALVVLIFYVLDVTRVCRQFIVKASKDKPEWPAPCSEKFAAALELKEALGEWMLVHLVAKRTDAVGKLIFYPFIIWFIMFLSRITYFDNWQTSMGLAAVISLGAVYAWSSAFVLRKSAENLRQASIHRLKQESVRLLWRGQRNEAWEKQIAWVLDEVGTIREGAFAPFSQHPVLQSLIVPFGGVGGMFLIDLLAKMNV